MSNQTNETLNNTNMKTAKFKFYVLSFIGILLFFTPMSVGEYEGVGLSILSDTTESLIVQWEMEITLGLLLISAFFTIITKLFKPKFVMDIPELKSVFDCGIVDFILRIVGAIFITMVYFQIGPEWIIGDSTGQEMQGLVFGIVILFLFSAFLLCCLIDFGLMDFFGILCTKFMRKCFTLPGRAALDTIASWVGSGSVGVVITNEAYEKGGYTRREAAVVMTMFSLTSVTYAIFMADYVGLSDKFLPYYFTCLLCGIVCAVLIPRIPPLSGFEDTYYGGVQTAFDEYPPEGTSMLSWAYQKGVKRAASAEGLKYYLRKGVLGLCNYWLALLPVVMAVGTIGLAVVEYTSVFNILAYPFQLILQLFQIPEAAKAAPGMITGFIDFFIPLPIANGIESLMTRFVVLCMSLVQIIYLTQVGALIMKSSVKVSFWQLLAIFLERTIVSLPIICIVAHIIF